MLYSDDSPCNFSFTGKIVLFHLRISLCNYCFIFLLLFFLRKLLFFFCPPLIDTVNSKCKKPFSRERTFCQSLVTSYQSLVASYQPLVASHQSPVTSHQLLVVSHQLLVIDPELLVTSYQSQVGRGWSQLLATSNNL